MWKGACVSAIISVHLLVGSGEEGRCLYMPRCMCVCSKFESGRECGFACGFVAGTLSLHTMHALDIPSAPVSVHKGLSPAFDMLESAAGLQR